MTREEILKGLDKIGDFFRARADMAVGDGKMLLLNWMKCAEEAAETLKAQASRVLEWENLYKPDGAVFVEYNPARVTRNGEWMFVDYIDDRHNKPIARFYRQHGEMESYSASGYGVTWRCWDRRPTKEESEALPWKS